MIFNKFKKAVSQTKTAITLSTLSVMTAFPALAGGLDDGTDTVNEIKTWGYTFLGAVVFVFMMYKVGLALFDKIEWADVLSALAKVAMAGGVIGLVEFAWAIFA
mgnify:CR=1 FL=1